MQCPVCCQTLMLSQQDAEQHVNACLDEVEGVKKKEESVMAWRSLFPTLRVRATSKSISLKSSVSFNSTSSTFNPTSTFNNKNNNNNNGDIPSLHSMPPNDTTRPHPSALGKRKCPFYKKIHGTRFVVDAFQYGRIPNTTCYFLSHFHSDHYRGLSRSSFQDGFIYCSPTTAHLLQLQLRIPESRLVPLCLNQRVQVEQSWVTLLDACHCPGAVMFLFEVGSRTLLHTGDFRADPKRVLEHPLLQRLKRLDVVYLDTTYCRPEYDFPSQELVIEQSVQVCQELLVCFQETRLLEFLQPVEISTKEKKRVEISTKETTPQTTETEMETKKNLAWKKVLLVVGTYLIGKERLVMTLASRLSSRVYMSPSKAAIVQCYEEDQEEWKDLLIADPTQAQIHVVSMQDLRLDRLQTYLGKYAGVFDVLIALHPTGWNTPSTAPVRLRGVTWTFAVQQRWCQDKTAQIIQWKQVSPDGKVVVLGVPYSEHSSFSELKQFVMKWPMGTILPTVHHGSPANRARMQAYFTQWQQEGADARKRKELAGKGKC